MVGTTLHPFYVIFKRYLMNSDFKIVEYNQENKEQMNFICSIHAEVLPDSFVVKMGNLFMKGFYYNLLPKLGFLKCYLAQYKGRYVGIIVTNKKPFSLIRSSMSYYFFRISCIVIFSILSKPSRLKTLIEVIKYKPDPLLKKFENSGKAFEILTIGVLNKYRRIFVFENKKISHLLLKHAAKVYKKGNYNKVTGQILKSNRMALGFYETFKANFIQSSVRKHGVILDLPLSNISL